MVKDKTRDNNILDLLFTTDNNTVEDLKISEPIGKSDHNTITFDILLKHVKLHLNKKVFNYNRGDYISIGKELDKVDWDKELLTMNVDDQWNFIKNKLIELRNKYIPATVLKDKKDVEWMTSKVKKLIQKKQKTWVKFQERKTYGMKLKYKKIRNKVIKGIRKAKSKFEEKLAKKSSDNRKSFYAYANKKKNK
jgi:hypothetical protein